MLKKITYLYIECFRNISKTGRQLLVILFPNYFVFFIILKLIFLPNILKTNYNTDKDIADHVIEQLATKIK